MAPPINPNDPSAFPTLSATAQQQQQTTNSNNKPNTTANGPKGSYRWTNHYRLKDPTPQLHLRQSTDADAEDEEEETYFTPYHPTLRPSPAGTLVPPETDSPIPKPSPAELDTLFQTEHLQISRLKGLRTFEAQLFSQPEHLYGNNLPLDHGRSTDMRHTLAYGPGCDAWFFLSFGEDIIPGESEMFLLEFFRMRRWISFDRERESSSLGVQGQGQADGEKWDPHRLPLTRQLFWCMELASRILVKSCETKWMQTVLGDHKTEKVEKRLRDGQKRSFTRLVPRSKYTKISELPDPPQDPGSQQGTAPVPGPVPTFGPIPPKTSQAITIIDPETGLPIAAGKQQEKDKGKAAEPVTKSRPLAIVDPTTGQPVVSNTQQGKEPVPVVQKSKTITIVDPATGQPVVLGKQQGKQAETEAEVEPGSDEPDEPGDEGKEEEEDQEDEEEDEGDDHTKSSHSLSNFDVAAQASRTEAETTGNKSKSQSEDILVERPLNIFYSEAVAALNSLAENMYWTFFDYASDPDDQADQHGRGLYRLRRVRSQSDGSTIYIVALNIDLFKPLLTNSVSATDRALAIHTAAIVMLRGVISIVERWKCEKYGVANLTYGDEAFADLPASFENAVFGGEIGFPFHHDRTTGDRNGKSLILTGCDSPCAGDWARDHFPGIGRIDLKRQGDWDFNPLGRVKTRWNAYPIPGWWSINMLRRSFWMNEVPYKGIEALHFPKDFRALEQRGHEGFGSIHIEATTFPVSIPKKDFPNQAVKSLATAVDAKRGTWETHYRKDWYRDALLRWQVTPYSMPQTRWMLRLLKKWMAGRTQPEEYLADEMLFEVWLCREPSANGSPLAWFYSAVGHMYAACLPPRDKLQWLAAETRSEEQREARSAVYARVFQILTENHDVLEGDIHAILATGISKLPRPFRARKGGAVERRRHLRLARRMGEVYFATRPHAESLKIAFMAALRHVEMQAKDFMLEEAWWECTFDLPPYTDRLGGINAEHPATAATLGDDGEFVEVGDVQIRQAAFHQFAANVADADDLGAPQLDAQLLKDTKANEVILQMRQAGEPVKYWSRGEIADHVSPKDLWVLNDLPNGEIEVVDISQGVVNEGLSMSEVSDKLRRTRYGFHVKDWLEKHFDADDCPTVGFVLQNRTAEDVAANNGTGGRPHWIYIGDNVFDITRFSYAAYGGAHLRNVLTSSIFGNPAADIHRDVQLSHRITEIVDRLMPYRCGKITRTFAGLDSVDTNLVLTEEDVKWYEFPESGMYVVIDGDIYDVSEYIHSHPGGRSVLAQFGGQDCTQAFKDSHPDYLSILTSPSTKALIIGRVVSIREANEPLATTEFEYGGYIYAPPGLDPSVAGQVLDLPIPAKIPTNSGADPNDAKFNLLGDEHVLVQPSAEAIARRQWWEQHRDSLARVEFCVAKRVSLRAPRPQINETELSLCDGVEGSGWFNEGWVAVKDTVYNMTNVVKYGAWAQTRVLKHFLGTRVANPSLADWIKDRYAFRIVARLTKPEKESKKKPERRWFTTKLISRSKMLSKDGTLPSLARHRGPRIHPPPYDGQPIDADTLMNEVSSNFPALQNRDVQRRAVQEAMRWDEDVELLGGMAQVAMRQQRERERLLREEAEDEDKEMKDVGEEEDLYGLGD